MQRREVTPDVASSLASIKTVVAIVNGLTLTNTLLVLITGGHYSRVIPIHRLSLVDIAFAVVLIANIVRFYHGNVRHLDVAYGNESYAHAASGRHVEPRGGLGVDFFVVFGQSLMFSAASFYVGSHATFLSIFVVLLVFDVIWTIYSQQDSDAASPRRSWLLNNIGALIALVILLLLIHRSHPGWAWPLDASLGILALTTAVDFGLSWEFYFPATRRGPSARDGSKPSAIFLSAPFTQVLAARNGDKEAFVAVWSELIGALEAKGHRVFSAHRREDWGSNLYPADAALTMDLQGLRDSDLMVAYVGAPPSPGVQLEIGYALAMQLPMLIFVDRDQTEPYLLRGVPSASPAEVVEIDRLGDIAASLAGRGMLSGRSTWDASPARTSNGHRRIRWRREGGYRA